MEPGCGEQQPVAADTPLPVDLPPGEVPPALALRRGSSVKKHHHKHNLKHRYELLETLGRGTYGKVKKAVEKHTGRVVSELRQCAFTELIQIQPTCTARHCHESSV